MDMQSAGSITHWIDGLKEGESVAAQAIWEHYFSQLVAIAQSRLRGISQESDGEDIALSALKSVMLGVQHNRFPDLTDRTGLWPLLVTITARKSIDQRRRQLVRPARQVEDIRAFLGEQPSPEFAIEIADELERLVSRFDDPILRNIARWKLEGCTNEEIAEQLSVSTRTVIRKLNRIREEWQTDESKEDSS